MPETSHFEGTEKLLELYFAKSPISLRDITELEWSKPLEMVHCKILSSVRNDVTTAYLLSESSLFVYDNRLILKTCGTTRLLNAVSTIVAMAVELGLKVEALFYSRKAFLFPEAQIYPHGSWSDEVNYLDEIFPKSGYDTSGYIIGKTNGDHWCLYCAEPLVLDPHGIPTGEVEEMSVDDAKDDITLEILMQGLDPEQLKKHFWRNDQENAEALLPHNINARKQSFSDPSRLYNEAGIRDVYPESIVDDYVFDPCGYSANGLLGKFYYTYHVTPEPECSYASFETTVPSVYGGYTSFNQVLKKVIDIFNPTSFSTVIVRRNHEESPPFVIERCLAGYRVGDRILHSLGKWEVLFCSFLKYSKIDR